MFTGIIEEKGKVKEFTRKANLLTLSVYAKKVLPGTKVGDSVAVDGVCLTVIHTNGRVLTFELMKETLQKTTLGSIKTARVVNLERALKPTGRLGGHFVQGHVDGIGVIKSKKTLPNYLRYEITVPKNLTRYIVPKGSVAIDGVSLTVGEVNANVFSTYLIPHTLDVTTLQSKKAGDKVNIETDILAKYILKS